MLARLHSVSKEYSGQEVLNSISLEIKERNAIAITGPSGSGKSTLLAILGTLDLPSSGEVFLDGRETGSMNHSMRADLRNRFIGFVFQQHHLLPQLTLLENVLLPAVPVMNKKNKNEILNRAMQLMERTGIAGLRNQFPGKSSVGECQRTAVVRALINRPSLLLADEPTGSLDNDNALRLGHLLRDLNEEEKIALVVVTHSAEIAALMKTRYGLHAGRLEMLS